MIAPRHNSSETPWASALRRRRRAFTLLELLTVIGIIGLLAGLVVGLAPLAGARMRESRMKAELNDLVTAIENYKARFGIYPPDNYDPVRRTVNPVLNPLYYELSGLVVTNDVNLPDGGRFVSADDGAVLLHTRTVNNYFNREGFVNSATGDKRRRLLRHKFKESQHAVIYTSAAEGGKTENLEVLAVGFSTDVLGRRGSGYPWPLNRNPQPVPILPGLNPWRYVSTNPTNNPGTFDLWAEIVVRGQIKTFGNWKQ